MIGRAKKDLHNGYGEVKEGMLCDILAVWQNHIMDDIWCEVKFKGSNLKMITSYSNIELIRSRKENIYV